MELQENEFAFPTQEKDVCKAGGDKFAGMTLRDYFAAKAMQGIISDGGVNNEYSLIATVSYKLADAMLKERKN